MSLQAKMHPPAPAVPGRPVAAHVQAALAAGAAQARRPDFSASATVPAVPAAARVLAKHVQAAVAQARFPAGGSARLDHPAALHSPSARTLAAHVQAAQRVSGAVQRMAEPGGGAPPPPPPSFDPKKYQEVAEKWDAKNERTLEDALKKGAERFGKLKAGPGRKTGGEKDFARLQTTSVEGAISSVLGGALFNNLMVPGEIHALENRLGGESFNNSEILFQQYKSLFPHLPKLRKLVRKNVASAEGAQVFLKVLETGSTQFFPGSTEFNALLGTPNGTAATYLILDHGQDLDISTISSAEIEETDSKIIFHFE